MNNLHSAQASMASARSATVTSRLYRVPTVKLPDFGDVFVMVKGLLRTKGV